MRDGGPVCPFIKPVHIDGRHCPWDIVKVEICPKHLFLLAIVYVSKIDALKTCLRLFLAIY